MNDESGAPSAGQILAQTEFFKELTAQQLERIAAISGMQSRDAGEQVYRIGEPAQTAYVLVRGMVRLTIGFSGRHASAGDILRRGDLFGWAAMMPQGSLRIATASCLTPCSLLAIDGAALVALMEDDHTLGYRLMTQLTRLITGTLTAFAGG